MDYTIEYQVNWLDDYLRYFSNETERLQVFRDYLFAQQPSIFHRSNFNGHITASAFVVNQQLDAMLLIRHKALGRWLQPGGHVEPGDTNLQAAALREAVEETGIAAIDLHYKPLTETLPFLALDIDPHYIPANERKGEPGHYHHDHRYLFLYSGDGLHNHNEAEVDGIKWVPFSELLDDATFGAVILKISSVFG